MSSSQQPCARRICEGILTEEKHYKIEHGIHHSEISIIDRMLTRHIELKDSYSELYEKLYQHPPALQVFFDLLLGTSALWSPEKIAQARTKRDELADVNRKIAKKAEELAELLERREDLNNTSGFCSQTHYDVCDVIEAASVHNHWFGHSVKSPLKALSGRFDGKYWPSLDQFVRVLAVDAENAGIEPTSRVTAAATATRRSLAGFFKALFAALESNSAQNYGKLPHGFKLTDGTLASLANCALGLQSDDLVDSTYVKRLRQRERNGSR